MSEFHIQVVKLGKIEKHPNADTLSTSLIHGGYPVIMQTGLHKEGDLVVYVPEGALVPGDDPRWAWLDGHNRIKAKRLRGVFSLGVLTPAEEGWVEGQDVQELLGITKYEPPESPAFQGGGGEEEADPGFLPVYTDIEGLRRWPDVLQEGEEVVLTEKIHGENARFLHRDGRLWVGSHHKIKRDPATTAAAAQARELGLEEQLAARLASQWWKAAEKYELARRLAEVCPSVAIYGEVHGYTGGYPYGVKKGEMELRLFDAQDTTTRRYLDYDAFLALAETLRIPVAPPLYRGPWKEELRALAEGKSTIDGSHIREGFVVRPVVERFHPLMRRVVAKMIGEGYLLKKK